MEMNIHCSKMGFVIIFDKGTRWHTGILCGGQKFPFYDVRR